MSKYPSVFGFNYTKGYYLTHPWKWVQEFCQHLHYAWRRARYGWTWEDTWNWDMWFSTVAPAMLRHLADNCSGYNDSIYDCMEEYQEEVRQLADNIELLDNEKFQERYNKYYDTYETSLDIMTYDEHKDIAKQYYDEAHRLTDKYNEHKKATFVALADMYELLWD